MRKVVGVLLVLGGLSLVGLPAAGQEGDPPDSPPSTEPAEPAPPSEEPAERRTLEGQFVPTANATGPIRGTAKLIFGQRGATRLSVHAAGLEPDQAFPTHLHTGACSEGGPVYSHDPNGADQPPNQLWASSDPADPSAPLKSSSSGNARGFGAASWTARPDARSVVIHSLEADGQPLACADLK